MELLREILSRNLLALRKEKRLTQSELALKLGLTTSAYSAQENGVAWPSSSNLEKIASFYGIRSTMLFKEDAQSDWGNRPSPKEIQATLQAVIDSLK